MKFSIDLEDLRVTAKSAQLRLPAANTDLGLLPSHRQPLQSNSAFGLSRYRPTGLVLGQVTACIPAKPLSTWRQKHTPALNRSGPIMKAMDQRETVLRGVIRGCRDAGFIVDGRGTMDGNPDRTDFTVFPVGCDARLYREWFVEVSPYAICAYGDTMNFTQLGPCAWEIEQGAEIQIAFSDFLTARLDRMAGRAKKLIGDACEQALSSVSEPSPPRAV